MKSHTIVGYTYKAETICPDCAVCATHHVAAKIPGFEFDVTRTEALLNVAARLKGIDRTDEHTFDSDDFPKVVFASQVDGPEPCDQCGIDLIDR